jgi:radical SAM protein with 4Fe4S-binding SPASM domain
MAMQGLRANAREWRILLATLTLRKVLNFAQILVSYALARMTGKPIHWGMPVSIGIEPTTACNLRCPQCPSGLRSFTRPTGRLQISRFQALIDELHQELVYLILYFQGEPFLNPDFLEMVTNAKAKGIHTCTSTNGHFLDDETAEATVRSGLHRLIISFDGLTQETYSKYRIGGEVDKVLTGLEALLRARKRLGSLTPFVDLQFIVFEHNRHEVEAVKALGRKLGVDRVSIKTAQVYDFAEGSDLIPKDLTYSRYKQAADGTWRLRNRLLNHCWKLWQGAEVTWDGRVLPCCFDKDATHQMGRFPEEADFATIWRSETYRAFRAQLTQGRAQIDICQNCTEGTQVWA